MPSFSLKRGISVSFQAITHLKSGPKQLGSLIILDLHAQDISNFGNGMAWLCYRFASNILVSHHLAAVSSPRHHACPCQ
jgi:hypothetical protein